MTIEERLAMSRSYYMQALALWNADGVDHNMFAVHDVAPEVFHQLPKDKIHKGSISIRSSDRRQSVYFYDSGGRIMLFCAHEQCPLLEELTDG